MHRLTPISLEELCQEAAMLTRMDRKYILWEEQMDEVVEKLDPATKVLEIDGQRSQPYRSVYFDTPNMDSFYMAVHPRRRKFKVRIRQYVNSEIAFAEVKARGARGVTVKERIPIPWDVAESHSLGEAEPWVREKLGLTEPLVPTMWGSYERQTLLMPDGGRATIDRHMDWANGRGDYVTVPGLVIVETKSGSRPSALDKRLWGAGIRPQKISKFGTGMAALDETLPRNRWHRVLNTYFAGAKHSKKDSHLISPAVAAVS
ncbi:MAG: polyphosphate polymerase domain-containing protein [Corynebacterium sp.]|nr:polyphosphate polymerase domain-containing protein [Corynebacterium sp.]